MVTFLRLMGQAFEDAAVAEGRHYDAVYRAQLRRNARLALRRTEERLPQRVQVVLRDLHVKELPRNLTWESAQNEISF